MVVSATVRYGTSMSHISLPQTSMSVDSWVVKEKSKNYHNWTSSASYDVCAPAFLIYAVWLWLNLRKMNVWLNQRGEAWGAELCVKRTIPPCFAHWFNWIFSIKLCRNTDKYKLQAVLHTVWNALKVWLWYFLVFPFIHQLASYMDVRSSEAAPWTARLSGSVSYHSLYGKT